MKPWITWVSVPSGRSERSVWSGGTGLHPGSASGTEWPPPRSATPSLPGSQRAPRRRRWRRTDKETAWAGAKSTFTELNILSRRGAETRYRSHKKISKGPFLTTMTQFWKEWMKKRLEMWKFTSRFLMRTTLTSSDRKVLMWFLIWNGLFQAIKE